MKDEEKLNRCVFYLYPFPILVKTKKRVSVSETPNLERRNRLSPIHSLMESTETSE